VYPVSNRVEAGGSAELIADVQDDQTPLDQMAYTWSSDKSGGTFTPINGSLRHVRWQPPAGAAAGAYVFTLNVVERYQDGIQTKQHVVSATTAPVHYNDSLAEILKISFRFLTELFPTFSVSPQEAVRDFSDSCQGKEWELYDVTINRRDFHILSGTYSGVSVAFNSDKTLATVSGRCVFRDIPNSGPFAGRVERVEGTCTLTALYERWNWSLCSSSYGDGVAPVPESLRYRVPGLSR
jgi:hypothetical protein